MCYTSARGLEMKAPFNYYFPTQTNDVLFNPQNPVNPDSNQMLGVNFILTPGNEKSMCPHIGGMQHKIVII
jgi:hypothetical protein